MRKFYCICFLLLLTVNPKAFSSHIYGGDLLYQHISGNTYRITVVLYGDCGSSDPNTFASLNNSTPEIYVYDPNNLDSTYKIYLPIDVPNSNIEVSPVCPGELMNTTCNNGALPGIKKFVYYRDITLPYTSTEWTFIFTGLLVNNTSAGRTNSITNIVFGSSPQIMYLVAKLNNSNGPNSSPVYNTVPTPFYCINIAQQYNQGASDPDGDSLSFALVPGLVNGTPTLYVAPYTAQAPLGASSFTFNNMNGQMSFTPNIIQKSLVVNEVREYKNGQFMGSSMREMSFIVLDNCQNMPPKGDLPLTAGIVGGINQGGNTVNVCAGASLVSFSFSPVDPDPSDDIQLSVYNTPPGAVVDIQNNNTHNPTVTFNWNTTGVTPGIYTFYINYRDNGCPIASNQTVAYTIQVANPYSLNGQVLSNTDCAHQAAVQFNMFNGIVPRTVTVMQGSNIIKTFTDNTGVINDSLYAGTYTVRVSSNYFECDAFIDFVVTDSGRYPVPPLVDNIEFCLGSEPQVLDVRGVPGSTIYWYNTDGTPLPTAPTYSTDQAGQYNWLIAQKVNTCLSDSTPISVIINEKPDVQILNQPGTVCYADKIHLQAQGAYDYVWWPVADVEKSGKETYGMVTVPITFTVIGTDLHSCKDTATISYTQIENCCNFAYPNAFTPNGDGRNDKFRPVLYGNMEEYELSIFNRFGQKIYYSEDAKGGWDGTFKGARCDVGMYYFLVRAKCYTGQKEEHSSAVNLLR